MIAVSLATNRFEGGWAGEMVSKHSSTAGWVYTHMRTCAVAWGMRYLLW